jgi:hypothetical protein
MRMTLTILVLCFCIGCAGHPSDQTLEDRFRSNEARFEELLKMLNEDSDGGANN